MKRGKMSIDYVTCSPAKVNSEGGHATARRDESEGVARYHINVVPKFTLPLSTPRRIFRLFSIFLLKTFVRQKSAMTELWLSYHQASRAHQPPTSQLVELGGKQKLQDLEDVLEYVFQQGFLDTKLRPLSWWEKCDGEKVRNSIGVDELLQQGVGTCEDAAMRLVIGA